VTVAAVVLMMAPMQQRVSAQSATGVMISEYRFRGPSGANDEFVELFNNSSVPVNISGWLIRASANNIPTSIATRVAIPGNTILQPYCYYLVANASLSGGRFSGTVTPNLTYGGGSGFGDDGGVALTTNVITNIIDQVGQGSAPAAFGEGTRLPVLDTNVDRGIERRPGGAAGHIDTNHNANDFREIFPGRPQNSSMCLVPQNIAIAASAAAASVPQGEDLVVFGVVAAGTLPPSSGVTVTGDLSGIGGSTGATLFDDGVAPDLVANDGIYTTSVNVPFTNPLGARSLTLTAADAQGRNASSTISVTVNPPAVVYLPHQVQGAGAVSPIALGDSASVRGVVTARKSNGFFVQTESGLEDADPNTSEGLFVFTGATPPAAAQVGHLVLVTAAVAELVPTTDMSSPSITAVAGIVALFDLGEGTTGAPVDLTSVEVSDAGALDQLERFEGMRVRVPSLTAVSGTGSTFNNGALVSDGAFYAVLTGQSRPFRTEGVESGYPLLPCAGGACDVPVFDGNPERLRVDSDALEGTSPLSLSSGAVMTDMTGPLDFELRTYTVLAEAWSSLAGGSSITAAAAASGDQFTTASLNLGLTSANAASQIAKASSMIRDVLSAPDIIAVQDVESVSLLESLASTIDTDADANGQSRPEYAAHEGFLLKGAGARVTMISVDPAGAGDTFVDPADGATYPSFERLPVLLRATVTGPATSLPQTLSVVAIDLASIDGADTGSVRARRQAQADFLAELVQLRQSADPPEAVVVIGNFNAFEFNDGYADVVGTILGTPAAPEHVATLATDVVTPDFVNVSNLLSEEHRYSLVANGNAQAFDHVLASSSVAPQFEGVVRPRVNADFADDLRDDASTPSRLSDRDPVVAYFSFPPDTLAPLLSNVPEDQVVEATGPDGATVDFTTPVATDNLDPSVSVSCTPASGSVFLLGNTGVTCSAEDAAGNRAEASFTVSVVDTTPPALSLPGHVNQDTASSSGAAVTFTATATDAVTASLTVSCTPASGSTFAVGDTVVTCAAADAAGNVATGSFVVTVTLTSTPEEVFGWIKGAGHIETATERVGFLFDVRNAPDRPERGWLVAQVKKPRGRVAYFVANHVASIQFSNEPGYAPGRWPQSGVDTVSFSGVGWYNGTPGYRFEAVVTDRGEPGVGYDTFTLRVVAPNGTEVLSTTGVLHDGNIQSLR
jgi:hypothetical protein